MAGVAVIRGELAGRASVRAGKFVVNYFLNVRAEVRTFVAPGTALAAVGRAACAPGPRHLSCSARSGGADRRGRDDGRGTVSKRSRTIVRTWSPHDELI